ncbi:glycosyl hydrolase [Nocardioides baekrokdamisoli]|uniref:Glycosyl hydrolase n=1 Tax=Nocardioides baekrokdamisoli TaxID=1804624 RepID=A0A3G9J4R0_9ACTN|nr:polysaccharide deacetylase family protein [Nocardioides baekrokdamisoli]BBH18648.1 glycosyl hydrolase [Nocardioides baekrokdamisoli]
MPLVLPRLGPCTAVAVAIAVSAVTSSIVAGFEPGTRAPHAAISLAGGRTGAINSAARPPVEPLPVATGGRMPRVDCRRAKCVALTFDDGPDVYTERLLRTLRAAHTRATFFMLGIQVQKFPTVARHVAAATEEVGDHTWDHKDLTRLSPHDVLVELARARTEIAAATRMWPAVFRPPYGSTNPTVARMVGGLGMPVILWNVDTMDWRDRKTSVVAQRAVNEARPGAIILMHDIYSSTVDAVPAIIKGLRQRGFTLVTVSQLLGSTRPGQTYFSR